MKNGCQKRDNDKDNEQKIKKQDEETRDTSLDSKTEKEIPRQGVRGRWLLLDAGKKAVGGPGEIGRGMGKGREGKGMC